MIGVLLYVTQHIVDTDMVQLKENICIQLKCLNRKKGNGIYDVTEPSSSLKKFEVGGTIIIQENPQFKSLCEKTILQRWGESVHSVESGPWYLLN